MYQCNYVLQGIRCINVDHKIQQYFRICNSILIYNKSYAIREEGIEKVRAGEGEEGKGEEEFKAL